MHGDTAYEMDPFNPFTKVMLKVIAAGLIVGSGAMALVWMADALPPWKILGIQFFLLAASATAAFIFLRLDRGKRVFLTPTELIIERGSFRWRIPWPDVKGVRLESPGERGRIGHLIARLVYGSDVTTRQVKIVLPYGSLPPTWVGPAGLISLIPGMNVIGLYLKNPEGFMRDAQQFTANWASSAE